MVAHMDWMFAADDTYILSQWLFLRLVGVIYLIAFWSLYVQIPALFGSKGISPISSLLKQLALYARNNRLYQFPTIFWVNSSDPFIKYMAALGIFSSFMVILGAFQPLFLFVLWFLYLSYQTAGSEFLSYQWDTLLLEVGFISIFFAMVSPPPSIIVFLLWFLLFRFMFTSGIVKYLYGSSEWRDLTAMQVHYESQPLPTRPAYYLHHMPLWFAKLSTLSVFFFEILVPLLIFSPLPFRMFAVCLLVFFQVLIMLTGNYTFFNLLACVMCVPLVPDRLLSSFLGEAAVQEPSIAVSSFVFMIALLLLMLNLLNFVQTFVKFNFTRPINHFLFSFRLVNNYGLFVHMTRHRDEIIVEGSEDGTNWKTYEFKWKPGNLKKALMWNIPHQPRLDWQMWFAALGSYSQNRWFLNFLEKLLVGSKEVSGLLSENPFKDKPPIHVRALFYRYHFTDLKTKKKTGEWWKREYLGLYCPVMKSNKTLNDRESPSD